MPQVHRSPKRTTHHKIPKSRNGSNQPSNLVKLDRRWHDTLHSVFGNLRPDEYFDALNRDSAGIIRRLIKALIRNFGVSVIKDALR